MKPNDKAIEALADVLQHHGVFHGWFPKGLPADWRQLDPIGRREFLDIAGRLADAAFAAQFQSEDYAGLVERLRKVEPDLPLTRWHRNPDGPAAADALEAVMAERDALKAENNELREENENIQAANRYGKDWVDQASQDIASLRAERDALLARLAPVEPSTDTLADGMTVTLPDGEEKRAMIAPVEDEELAEIARQAILKETNGRVGLWPTILVAAIAAIRPHIEAAERERCAKIAETPELWVTDKPSRGCDDIAAAIRSGK